MARTATKPTTRAANPSAGASLMLVWGDDDYAVKQRAREAYTAWCAAAGGMDHEIIDGGADTVDQVRRVLGRLREALQTLPFFGTAKVVWLKDCTFLGEERVSAAQAVTQAVGELASELQQFRWEGVRLLISAGRVDRRRAFYKTVAAIGTVEMQTGLSPDDKDWVSRAETFVERCLKEKGQRMEPPALAAFVARVGPDLRALAGETEKLSLYLGNDPVVRLKDVETITSRGRQTEAFALPEALGDRDLARCLRTLDEELWRIRVDREGSPIGLLYGLIAKVRLLLLVKELVRSKHLREGNDYAAVRRQLECLPEGLLPADKRINPALMHPFPVFKALGQCRNYETAELTAAMDILLECNLRLVSSSLEDALLLQQALVRIVGRQEAGP